MVVLPDSGRQGLKYEINGIDDDSVYVNSWPEVVKKIKEKFPKVKKVNIMSNMGIVSPYFL